MREVEFEGEAVGAALWRARKGREKAIAVVIEALSGDKANAIMDLGRHHVRLDLGVLFLELPA